MTEISRSQPKEAERIACSGCGGFLRLEAAMPAAVGHARYDMMRCVGCDSIQWVAEESFILQPNERSPG
jgi:hypothetical protein